MGRASSKHRKTRTTSQSGQSGHSAQSGHSGQAGRHRGPARASTSRAVKIVGVAVPAVALAGTLVALQAQPARPDPVARSTAAYRLGPVLTGTGAGDVGGALLALNRHLMRDASSTGDTARQAQASKSDTSRSAGKGRSPAPAASKSTSPSAHRPAATTALTCTGIAGTGMLPQNYSTIVNFLVAHGYTDVAAAGVAGNIYQESDGNPESVGSGGGGLIGWTPLPAGFVTGNVAADLQTQLQALLAFNQQWAQYIPALNAAASPTAAADIYMNYFERPGLPAAYNREDAAAAVAQACGI